MRRIPQISPVNFSSPIKMPIPRYYKHNLSQEDKEDLAKGDKNDNLKEWNKDDVMRFKQESKEFFKSKPVSGETLARLQKNALISIEETVEEEHEPTPVSPRLSSLYSALTPPISPPDMRDDYFQVKSPTHPSQTSSRISAPLSREARQFTSRREVTFDSFLHLTGKGLVHPDNAIKSDDELDRKKKVEKKKANRMSKLPSKMPSMPILRRRRTGLSLE
jgi:hypothetical protein